MSAGRYFSYHFPYGSRVSNPRGIVSMCNLDAATRSEYFATLEKRLKITDSNYINK